MWKDEIFINSEPTSGDAPARTHEMAESLYTLILDYNYIYSATMLAYPQEESLRMI